jgi:hypothetical protein
MPKMLVSVVITMTTNNEQRTMNFQKRTQTKPILSQAFSPELCRMGQSRDLSKQQSASGGFRKRAFGFSLKSLCALGGKKIVIRPRQYRPAGFRLNKSCSCRCVSPLTGLCRPARKARQLLPRHEESLPGRR